MAMKTQPASHNTRYHFCTVFFIQKKKVFSGFVDAKTSLYFACSLVYKFESMV